MNLRYVTLCDEQGVKRDIGLQVWNEEYRCWEDVPCVEYKAMEFSRFNDRPED